MREIDWDNPTEEDKAWVDQYGSGAMRRKIERGMSRRASVDKAVSEDEQDEDDYENMNLNQLKAVAKDRKRDNPDFDVTGVTNKGELIDRLRQWDADHPEEE
jgi:hypothetical protein